MKPGRTMWWVGVLLAGCGCGAAWGGGEQAPLWEPDPRPLARTLVYGCPGADGVELQFTARLGPGEMAIWFEDRYLVLSRVRSASGVKYEEGDVLFWGKGDEAMLHIGSRHYAGCRLLPARAPWEDARRRGVLFRAAGNTPGWYLEVGGEGGALFVRDDGSRLAFPATEQSGVTDDRVLEAAVGAHHLRVEIVTGPCVDTLQGDTYPARVVVQVDGESLQGCGMDLYPGTPGTQKIDEKEPITN